MIADKIRSRQKAPAPESSKHSTGPCFGGGTVLFFVRDHGGRGVAQEAGQTGEFFRCAQKILRNLVDFFLGTLV